jgi:hypothetical protein
MIVAVKLNGVDVVVSAHAPSNRQAFARLGIDEHNLACKSLCIGWAHSAIKRKRRERKPLPSAECHGYLI